MTASVRRAYSRWVGSLFLLVFIGGCQPTQPERGDSEEASAPLDVPAQRTYPDGTPRVVALGDSLTAGLGVSSSEAYPARLQERLDAEGYTLEVVNAGVSGDTSAGGLRRLDWSLAGDVAILIVALGGNDGLRGLPVEELRRNLAQIIATAQSRGVSVILTGMEAPPNFGTTYTDAFRSAYQQLADEYDVVFVPFLLEGVAGVEELNQADGIHPNAVGAERVAEHLWPSLEEVARHVIADRP